MRINPHQRTANFRAEDISRPLSLQIASVREVAFGTQEKKYVVDFVNEARSLVLNQTNLQSLCGFFGDDTDKWIGGRVELFTQMTSFNGTPVPGIRVRRPMNSFVQGPFVTMTSPSPDPAFLGPDSNLTSLPQIRSPRIQLDNPAA